MVARKVFFRVVALSLLARTTGAGGSEEGRGDVTHDAPPSAGAADSSATTRILVTLKQNATKAPSHHGATGERRAGPRGLVLVLESTVGRAQETLAALAAEPEVQSAELDSLLHLDASTSIRGPKLPEIRGRRELRQTVVASRSSSAGAVEAPAASSDAAAAPPVVVCVIDSGVDYRHPDLVPYLWRNPGETGIDALGRDKAANGVDDDANGFVDDVHGIDSRQETGDPDELGGLSHGTHLAGIVASVVGETPNVYIMACRYTNDRGNGYTSDAMMCIDYAMKMGAQVVSASWGGHPYSEAFEELAAEARDGGVVIVASAGNKGQDNDITPYYPAGYRPGNIISVTSVSSADGRLSSFASYGATSVDIAAPGTRILSTIPGGGYGNKTGTSQSVAHVAGAAGVLFAQGECVDWAVVKEALLVTATPSADLLGKTLSGGMLSLPDAVAFITCDDDTPTMDMTNSPFAD